MRIRWLAPAGLAAAALVVAACGSSAPSTSGGATSAAPAAAGSSAAASGMLLSAKVGGATVLTNAKGFTLYWFALDTPATSKCTGDCAQHWPPVKAPATAGTGVTGKLGAIKRSDGSMQATYNGHPLYTYTGDTAPGEAKGNGVKLSGGVWHDVTVSGAAAGTGASPSSAPSGGYGY